ncbi:MFS transporter [Microbacterium sp. M3]|uniref:MFS transporter n=1 Tax=Microbacterium arthrosphaerae TaxID=792652 RepID=A0ABU4H4P9_9MICO|nr:MULTISPECIES: MFS transporter [Microbacterium]MDW4574321.1 MFS transporter [Microbacterium arthrosphaerae]MDW7608176.1 MFS transporter [Microbacterium sp. M3]
MKSTPARPLWQGRTLALAGIVLFAFSLRSAVASLSPLFDHIAADFELPAAVIGLIGTAPPVCFAIFGLLTPALERRFGLERLAVVAMAVVAAGLVARSLAPNSGLLLAGTALVFAAVGTGNILLPPLVKRYFPDRIGLMTTVFSTTMAVATFVPPLIAVPVADAADWRLSLGLWAVFALVAMIPWIGLAVRRRADGADGDIEQASPRVFGRMWRVPLAWALLVAFAVSSTIAYTSFAWMPKMLVDIAGVTPATAGALLSLFGFMGLPASLVVPLLVTRWNATRLLFGIAVTTGLAGFAGLLFAPTAAPWLWVVLVGLAPLLFPMILVLLGLRTRTHEGSVALSGLVQSGGYAIAALFPVGIGLIHDATDSWTVPLIILACVVAAAIPAGVVAARPHTVEDDWERRHGAW